MTVLVLVSVGLLVYSVGYGDIVPLTPEGRAVATALIFSGIGVLAFSTSIVVAAFQDKLLVHLRRELGACLFRSGLR